jgi:hypothetical protein
MEYLENEIVDVIFTDTNFTITYDNSKTEVVEKNKEGYKKLYDAWLLEQPMFISDIYKTQMRDLAFATRNNAASLNQLNNFLSEGNKTEAIKFITYMRKRDLTFEREKWIKLNKAN